MPQGIKHIIVEVRHWQTVLLFAPGTLVISYCFKQCHTDNCRAKNNSFCSSYTWLLTLHLWMKYHQHFCQQERTKVISSLTLLNTGVTQNKSSQGLWTRHLVCNIQTVINIFCVYGSVHRWSILIIVQRDATQSSLFIILQFHSSCFGCQLHPWSGVHKTITIASGTGHVLCAATSLQRGHVGGR